MSDRTLARRTAMRLSFDGIDISQEIQRYLISVTYTDNEEDETDDLQIKLQDRDGLWTESWLGKAIDAAAEQRTYNTASAEASAGSSSATHTVNARSGLNVRSGAGTGYSILGTLPYGTSVTVTGTSGNWSIINYSGKTGYVYSTYLTKSSSAGESYSGAACTVNAKSGLNVRSGPGTGYSVLGALPYGTTVTVTGTSGDWSVIQYSGKTGYVFSKYLSGGGDSVGGSSGGTQVASGFLINAAFIKENWKSDGKDAVLDCGSFELDSVQASGPPSTVTIKATSLPFSASIRQTRKSKAWEAYTLSGIAQEMAASNGMACLFLAERDPYYARTEQYNTSDIAFLSRLCKNAGISLKASNRILILFDQAAYEQKASSLTITKGDKSYLKWDLKVGTANTKYQSCRVRYTSPTNGRCIEGTAYIEDYKESENNQQLEISAKVSNVAEAKSLAEKMLRAHNKYSKTAVFTLHGNTAISAGMTVKLAGWGAWSGKYIIKQAVHSAGSSGYTTKITLRRVLEGY